MTTVIRREAAFIPIKDLTPKLQGKIKEKLTFSFFAKEKICEECEWFAERINDVCESCANYKGSYELASQVKVGENKYMKVPLGSWKATKGWLERHLPDEIKVKSKHPTTTIPRFKFTGEFRDGQEEAVEAMLRYKRGILRAPPRSGKTVLGTVLTSRLQVKTLILASQRDWLMGFQETYIGSDTQKPLTDLNPKRIKLCKTFNDFESTDICLATVQTFYSPAGEKLLRKIRDLFTCILIDEVHTVGADKYAMIASRLNAEYFIGFSGTPTRKDCVSPETLVTMGDGTEKQIQHVNVGDFVLSVNTESGSLEPRAVLESHVRPISKMLSVHIGDYVVKCTADHKFLTHRGWVAAGDLTPTDHVFVMQE